VSGVVVVSSEMSNYFVEAFPHLFVYFVPFLSSCYKKATVALYFGLIITD